MAQPAPNETMIKIQSKGVLTIPKKLRQALGLEEDSLARLIAKKGRLIIEPVRTLPYPVRSYTDQEVNEFLDLDSQETKQLKKEGLL